MKVKKINSWYLRKDNILIIKLIHDIDIFNKG